MSTGAMRQGNAQILLRQTSDSVQGHSAQDACARTYNHARVLLSRFFLYLSRLRVFAFGELIMSSFRLRVEPRRNSEPVDKYPT